MIKKQNANFVRIVNMLADGKVHDGATMGAKLSITRGAIWKAIKKLQEYDIQISAVKGQGYALLEPLILLDKQKIKQLLSVEGVDLNVFESVPSTNDLEVKAKGKISICLAEQQTKGRGRLHREWHSPFGQNLYLTCFYTFQKDITQLGGLSLVVSLAIIAALESLGLKGSLMAKWPNDILYENKKLSGVLIDLKAEAHGKSEAVIGIGININMMGGDELPSNWISLRKILGLYLDRNILAANVVDYLITYLKRFDSFGFAEFVDDWTKHDYLQGKKINLQNLDRKKSGLVMGVSLDGHLLMQLDEGESQAFSAGDTTILKNNNEKR